MIYPAKKKSSKITSAERIDNALVLTSARGMHRIVPFDERTVRITYTERNAFSQREKPGVIAKPDFSDWSFTEADDKITYRSKNLIIEVNRETSSMTYLDGDGKKLLSEKKRDPKTLEEFDSYIIKDGKEIQTEKITTADGVKDHIVGGGKELDGKYYHTRLELVFAEGEALYGLGQHEEGILNLRGKRIYSHQANKKIEIPFLVSTNGYGILYDTYSPLIFSDTELGSYIYSEADDEMDYYFIADSDLDGVIRGYRRLTGKAVMLPKWAFGYIQSKERYVSEADIVSAAKEFRKRKLGIDCIVLDWQSWPGGLWGQKSLDPERFPNPKRMTDTLHENNVKLMLSIWPNCDERSDNYREFYEKGQLLPAGTIYNAFDPDARKTYWDQLSRELFCRGIDAWWCDSSEPYTPEWNHNFLREPNHIYSEYLSEASGRIPAWETSAFGLYHAMGIYEGQRSETDEMRVCNLTRSGFTGQQRYGTILWSGDVSASWNTFKRQIAAGIGFSASGLPYWTTDIGAFFIKYGLPHYWDGEYDGTSKDAGYRELYVRWLQWSAFLPIFRAHGTDCDREPWAFEDDGTTPGGNMFYGAIEKAIKLRYRLIPYIYSLAADVYHNDSSFIKPLAFEFSHDARVLDIKDQYMFGDALMVCPVTEPMYFEHESKLIEGAPKTRTVYLPEGTDWYDFATNERYRGGSSVTVPADIDTIPVFVRAGSIIPVTEPKEHTYSRDEVEYLVYSGADGEFLFYEDAGDGYAYENGEYKLTRLHWCDAEQKLCTDGDVKYTLI